MQRRHLLKGLSKLGFEVLTSKTSAQVWQALMRQQFDALVLDASASSALLDPWLLMTELGGLDHPLLVVFVGTDRIRDRLRAFRHGVCYCLNMPVSPPELAALLTAVEGANHNVLDRKESPTEYSDAVLHIDLANAQIRRKGKTFPLTGRERSLLQRMLKNAGRVSTSEELCKSIWGRGTWPAKRVQLKIHIMQLRHKIERDHRHPHYLISHRGLGYAFMPRSIE
jgi:two-component system KDP operon response regulator KdpE